MRHIVQIAVLAAVVMSCGRLQAELVVPHILSDNMMLQLDKPMRIWGKEDEGATVTVTFKDQNKSTVVRNGQWSVMGETHCPEAAEYPPNDQVRLFKQQRQVAAEPVFDTLKTGWASDSSASRRHFSAVAYYFARELHEALGVPVGIMPACDGGTNTQYWTPLTALEGNPQFKATLDEAIAARNNFAQLEAKFEADKKEHFRKRNAGEKTGSPPTFYGRVPCAYYNGMIHPTRKARSGESVWAERRISFAALRKCQGRRIADCRPI